MKIINFQDKIYLIATIYSVVALLLFIFLIYPTFKEIKKNSNAILSNKNQAVLTEAEMGELDDFKRKYQSYKPKLEVIEKLFVNSKNPIDFVKFLEKISVDYKLVSDINLIPSQNKSEDGFLLSTFQISSKGDISNVLKFIEKLEMGPYLIEVQKVNARKLVKNTNNKDDLIGENDFDVNFFIVAIVD